jgi:hypothetical protein
MVTATTPHVLYDTSAISFCCPSPPQFDQQNKQAKHVVCVISSRNNNNNNEQIH